MKARRLGLGAGGGAGPAGGAGPGAVGGPRGVRDRRAGRVRARPGVGRAGGRARSAADVAHLEQIRAWFGRPLWDMEPADADVYFGKVLRDTAKGTRLARAQALKHVLPVPGAAAQGRDPPDDRPGRRVPDRRDEPAARRPRRRLRIPPTAAEVERLFAGWRERAGDLPQVRPDRPQLHRLRG